MATEAWQRLRQVADRAYEGEMGEFVLTFGPELVSAMLDVIDAAEEALRAYHVDAVSPVEMSAIAVKLGRLRNAADAQV